MIAVTVSGRVGKAEVRQAGENKVLSFSIASNDYRNKQKVTDWVSCSFFGKRAEQLAQYVAKGAYVTVRGKMFGREFEGKNGKMFSLELLVDDLDLGPSGGASASDEQTAGQQARGQQSAARKPASAAATADPVDDFMPGDPDIPF